MAYGAPESKTLLASAARTATVTGDPQTSLLHRGLHLIIDVTAVTLTPSVVFTIQAQDPASGQWYTVLASAAITATGTTVLKVYPGITAAANLAASDVLPHVWRLLATHADADSITYSCGVNLLP